MKSRILFVVVFVACAALFLMITILLLDQPAESLFGTKLQSGWQYTASIILSPLKIVLVGPLIPFIDFLRQDPDTPPPFFLAGFILYWAVLALVIYYLYQKMKRR